MSKILVVLGKDVHNKPVYQVYYELKRRNNEVDVYAIYFEDIHLSLFRKDCIKVHSFFELKTVEDLEKYQYIYTAIPLYQYPIFRTVKRYIFSTPTTYTREVYFCSDFSFMTRKMHGNIIENEKWGIDECNLVKMAPCMASGNPMHDGLSDIKVKDNKNILFIDSGHFPFGGKREVADIVIRIAKALPEFTIRIKPRFLKGDKNVTHRNEEYLIDYLRDNDMPKNIEIIREHTDLRDELKNCYLLISNTVTTSYIEAALANRRILLLEGFPNEESLIINRKAVERQGKIAGLTKCVVKYKEVLDYLPEGLICSDEFLNKFIYKRENITKSIVDAMEYIYDEFISKNKFPKEKFYYIDDYKEKMESDERLTWESVLQRRYRVCLYDISYYDARIDSDLNFETIIEAIEATRNIAINEDNYKEISNRIYSKLLDLFFENKKKIMATALSQSYFFELLYNRGRFSEIREEEVLCNAYYKYLKAKEYSKNGEDQKCIELLNEYFSEVDQNVFDKTLADEYSVKASGHYYRGVSYFNLCEFEKAKEEFEVCDELWNGNHKCAKKYIEIILRKLK